MYAAFYAILPVAQYWLIVNNLTSLVVFFGWHLFKNYNN